MGDGGVACMPSQLVVEGFPASEKLCGSGSGELEKKMRGLERRGMSGSGDKGRKTEERSKAVELENGEFVPDRREKGGSEKGEELREDGELEKGEIVPDDWCDRELEKGEFVPEKSGKGVAEKSKVWLETGHKGELEKGEFVPDKWPKWDRERSPSNQSQKVESGRSDRKRLSSKLDDCSHERREDTIFWKHGNINGGSHGKECVPGSILKRHHVASEVSGGKYQREFKDHSGAAKSRKISDKSSYCRSEHFEKSQRGSTYPPSRASSTTRYSSRHIEPYFSARGNDKHGRSPENSLERLSVNDRSRHHDRRNRSPLCSERSPHQLTRHRELRERTPIHLDKSPHQRSRHHDHKDRNSSYAGRSPHERNKHRDHKDKTPVRMEHSPRDRDVTSRQNGTTRRSVGAERKNKPDARNTRRDTSVCRNTGRPEVATLSSSKDRNVDDKSDFVKDSHKQRAECSEPPPPPPLPPPPLPPPPVANGVQEDLPSMEEDMDICDTPPHSVATTDPNMGKWYYLDHFGTERGPSKLMDLKKLVGEGVLLSDHLIKHTDSDRWVTVENAASPLVYADLHPIVSDNVTQLVSPPEAPGNLLNDADNVSHDGPGLSPHPANDLDTPQFVDLGIDERVVALLDGYDVIPGKELETLGEALGATFVHAEWENWGRSEGFSRSRVRNSELTRHLRDEESCRNEIVETRSVLPSEKEFSSLSGDSSDWFAGRWSCKGGDWKRNEDLSQERLQKTKLVLNDGYPLCLMPKCGYEDPRWQAKDDLYHVSCGKKLDLPTWSFSWLEDKVDSSDPSKITSRSSQVKLFVGRGTKGIMLPVIRINACVVKDHGFSASESRSLGKSNDRHSSRSMRSYNGGNERSSLSEGIAQLKGHGNELHKGDKFRLSISIPSDRVCTRDELGLHMGDWYYLDGTGREHGPYLFSELQEFVSCGTMLEHTSVFRKADNIWVPVTSKTAAAKPVCSQEQKDIPVSSCGSLAPLQQSLVANRDGDVFSSFHGLHPQFIGFMCGRLHELIMKFYRSREFGAAINGVLDPWLNMNQPKELDKNFWKSEADLGIYNHMGKRPRLSIDSSCEDHDMDEDVLYQKDICSFDELCAAASSSEGNDTSFSSESWGLLNSRILSRIFHFLRNDMKTLLFSAATCKHWKIAVKFYKDICRCVDFSTAGPNCTDPMFQKIMNGYDGKTLTTLILTSCTNLSASALEEVLRLFPGICTIDIRGCNQFEELIATFQNVKWIHSQIPSNRRSREDAHLKTWSHKQNTEKSYSMAKSLKGSSNYQDGFNDGDNSGAKLTSTNRMDFKNETFKQGYYRRTKLLDARKSSGALSRDAQLKQLMRKKSENAYRKMKQLIANALRNIMKDNSFEFLIPKVKGIEDKMQNGYYARHGLTSIKDDIRLMCRNIIKNRRRSSNVGELKHIISSFLQLAEQLDNPRHSYEGESLVKAFAESSDSGSYSADLKYKKKTNKIMSEKNYASRNTNSYYANGESNYKVNDIKRRLSKLSKRYADSDSETSDDGFFDDANDEGGSSGSETESDLDMRSEVWQGSRNDFFILDEVDTVDDREWGARMTKASLVPPVTRKYEVIEKYLIVADEIEVERKMTVALPDDYTEKLAAQCNGVEEMEIPEVKDYKPRKLVGVEVLEQEVYGIDPYTHNLLLDSMQEMDLPLAKMHLFIEEVLLRALNKQVREFTGTGNAPMVYQLQPVIEEVKRTAEMDGEIVTMKMCNTLLKSMRNRSVENYVAYRKGLGVVCNTEKGFSEDDFVVEFLGEVYPAWRWYEKQDGIRSLQKSSKEPLPEFYNIYLERPKGDSDGYDLVVVDAMHKANYASRICHSCRPNCEAKVTAVDGRYQIGIYTLRPIDYGEEITFDYNSVTESKDEYEASVCLCGSQICRGSYLNLTGEEAFQNILKDCHGMLDLHKLILEACETSSVSQEDYIDLAKAGLGSCLLAGLPDWLIAYSAHLVRFINFERRKLPEEILRHNMEEKKKYIPNYNPEDDKNDAEVQAEGVFNQRLQNMAVTIDKVKHVMKSIFGDPKKAPPPLQKLSPEEIVFAIWKGDGSVVEELLKSMAVYMEADLLNEIKLKIRAHDPFGSADLRLELKRSLIWLRDEIRDMPCSQKCRNDAAADLIHMYAYTENFFKIREYESFTSPPVYISPLDMGPKYMETMGSGFQEYCKTYGKSYCLGQLIFWHNQTNPDPDSALAKARRGCLSLPDVSSFYANPQKPTKKHVYGAKTLSLMLRRMEYFPQRPWPKDQIWEFKPDPKFFGSPMLDTVLNKRPLDADMMHWLKNRPPMFQGARDG